MSTIPKPPRILLVGLSARLIFAMLVLIGLWAGFLWATSMPGGV